MFEIIEIGRLFVQSYYVYVNDRKISTRVFLDSGSQKSFISPKLVEQLQLPVVARIPIQITTFGSEIMAETLDLVKVKVKTTLGFKRVTMKLLVHEHASTVINCPILFL